MASPSPQSQRKRAPVPRPGASGLSKLDAEGGGFEPPGLITQRFSRPSHSSALPSLQPGHRSLRATPGPENPDNRGAGSRRQPGKSPLGTSRFSADERLDLLDELVLDLEVPSALSDVNHEEEVRDEQGLEHCNS